MRVRSSALVLVLVASCGGEGPRPTSPTPSPSATQAAFTSDVPRKPMPPPFHFGSKRATVKEDPRATTCAKGFAPQGDLAADVTRLAQACALGTHAVGAPFTGTQGEGAPAQHFKVKVDAGKCYRVFGVTASTVKNVEVLMVDSEGTPAVEARSDASFVVADPRGSICWSSSGDAEVVVSVGAGAGAFAVQLASD